VYIFEKLAGAWQKMNQVNFYGLNREFFFVITPEAFSSKCFTCVNCNENCDAGKIVMKAITCMKCVYPGEFNE